MRLALLPVPNNKEARLEGQRMKDFMKQLPQVSFDLLLKEGEQTGSILDNLLEGLDSDALATLVVSDRDDYLRSAKEAGMVTCRVRPHPNAPRGNISAHYNVTNLADVQDVVNEINGISFNAVFSAR
eukprot:CAMPEP_0202470720 /NCGR_PEP_ID=MMETSP1360-20130828/82384_1 /ASSEMBLY_ACC=CAM_ASM_000848 /TAXON_ID=515479 /ORGANISM="Licmophora paradoxa, Strain CCMP2313" /LENGTH=126 /DNA_ID=CAMNT_0049096513 /DNA_START=123 /DNA_END=503 /DNA_ORIENTATION=-